MLLSAFSVRRDVFVDLRYFLSCPVDPHKQQRNEEQNLLKRRATKEEKINIIYDKNVI